MPRRHAPHSEGGRRVGGRHLQLTCAKVLWPYGHRTIGETGLLADEQTRDEIMDLLEGLWRERGLTLVLVTHDSAVAARAERRLHIKHGTVREV